MKIKSAAERADGQQRDHEIQLLGPDLDRYRDSIAAASAKDAQPHWLLYRRAVPILLEHKLADIEQVIADLEIVSGAEAKR